MNKRKTPKTNLENKKTIFLEIGFIIALCLVLAALEYKSYHYEKRQKHDFTNSIDEDIDAILITQKQIIPKKPIPKTIFKVVDDHTDDLDDVIFDVFDLPESAVDDWLPPDEPENIEDDLPYHLWQVSKEPQFPGGIENMYRYLANNFKIPRIDKEMGNQGKIFVEFIIDKDGYVKYVRIERGLSPTADAEALRVVESMPQWEPAQQGIKKVSVRYILPISVKLM